MPWHTHGTKLPIQLSCLSDAVALASPASLQKHPYTYEESGDLIPPGLGCREEGATSSCLKETTLTAMADCLPLLHWGRGAH